MGFEQTDDEGLRRIRTIQLCTNCDVETTKGRKYCNFCDTAAKRHEMEAENELVKKENLEKGFKYTDQIIGKSYPQVLKV